MRRLNNHQRETWEHLQSSTLTTEEMQTVITKIVEHLGYYLVCEPAPPGERMIDFADEGDIEAMRPRNRGR